MKRQQWVWYAVAVAILVVGLVWAGVPASTLAIAALVLVCPLMMLFMMRGMNHSQPSGHEHPDHHDIGQPPSSQHGGGSAPHRQQRRFAPSAVGFEWPTARPLESWQRQRG